jgi:hypothetical protein
MVTTEMPILQNMCTAHHIRSSRLCTKLQQSRHSCLTINWFAACQHEWCLALTVEGMHRSPAVVQCLDKCINYAHVPKACGSMHCSLIACL